MKIDFKEGRGFEFTTAVEEVKTRHDTDRGQRQDEAETLRKLAVLNPGLQLADEFYSLVQPTDTGSELARRIRRGAATRPTSRSPNLDAFYARRQRSPSSEHSAR